MSKFYTATATNLRVGPTGDKSVDRKFDHSNPSCQEEALEYMAGNDIGSLRDYNVFDPNMVDEVEVTNATKGSENFSFNMTFQSENLDQLKHVCEILMEMGCVDDCKID